MRGKYVIAGIGHTKFGRLPGRGTVSMNVEACRNAFADAGIEKSAVDARSDQGFVIMARTDALAMEGLDAAIERAVAYVEAGADMIFAEAVTELPMYRKFKAAVKVPILANITEFGFTPLFTTEELRSAEVDIVLYCCGAYRAMNAAALKVYEAIRADGTQKNVVPIMQSRVDLYKYLGYNAYEQKLDELFAQKKK